PPAQRARRRAPEAAHQRSIQRKDLLPVQRSMVRAMTPSPVTDPALLAELNEGADRPMVVEVNGVSGMPPAPSTGPQPVTDPELLRELNGDGLPPAVRDEDPARAGRVNQLARDTELPRDAVEQGLDEIEAARRAEHAAKVAEGAPSVRRRLTDPATAAITQDDVEGLSYLEQVGRAWDRSVASTRRGLTVQTLTYVMDRQRELSALDAKIAAGEHISLDEDPAGYASMSDLERRAYRLDLARNLRDGLREYGARTAELQMA